MLRVGVQVRMVREFKGVTVSDLAKKADVSRQYVYRLEDGANVGLQTLQRVCDALGVTMAELMRVGEQEK